MKQRKSNYWRKRYKLLEEARYRDNEKLYKEIEKEYIRAAKKIEKEILSFYNRFALNNGITLQEARKLLNSDELEELRWDVWEYIDKGIENSITGSWKHELENASIKARVRRLEALKLKIDAIISELQSEVLEQVDNHITDIYENSYYNTAFELQKGVGVGVDLAPIDVGRVALIKSKPWASDGLSFSERIWGKHRLELTKYLDTELTQSIIRGEDPQKLINKISKKFNTTKRRAGNVVMTESAYFASVAQEECYKDLDVDRYEIVATLDTKTSKICQDMDGEVFDMNEYEPWVTAPPFHNFCRSVTAPYFEDFTEGSKRWYRDADGNTGYVDADMKYNEWYDKYIENSMEEEYTEIVNDFENEKEFRKVEIDEKITKNASSPLGKITLEKIKNTDLEVYKSVRLNNLKPAKYQRAIVAYEDAIKLIGLSRDDVPPLLFCKGDECNSNISTLASYSARLNYIKLNVDTFKVREKKTIKKEDSIKFKKENDVTGSLVHELYHYLDAKEYREQNNIKGQMTQEQKKDFEKWVQEKAKDIIIKNNLNPKEISNYANKSYKKSLYDEVCAEYTRIDIVEKGGKKWKSLRKKI